MKKKVLIIFVFLLSVFVCVSQDLIISCASIKKETTKISYYHHTNSGVAIYTSVTITPDSLIWNYSEARNGVNLCDVTKYNKTEFLTLIEKLSDTTFFLSGSGDRSVGGSGFSLYFETESGNYLTFDQSQAKSSGSNQVVDLITGFIENHPTRCEQLFREYAQKPHQRGHFGEFQELPKELEQYRKR